jgi:hypothetical protein
MIQESHGKTVDNLCLHCRDIDVEKLLLGRDYLGPVQLRGYQEILQQDDCALCRVFIQALSFSSQSYWQKDITLLRYATLAGYKASRVHQD